MKCETSQVDSRSSARGSPAPARGRGTGPGSSGLSVVYGRNAVREAIRGRRRVHTVFLADARSDEAVDKSEEAVTKLLGVAARQNPPSVRHVSVKELTAYLGNPDHQGVAAEVDPYPYTEEQELLERFTLLVALDEVQDPHNLGAVIRTAEASGAGVLIPRHRAVEVTAAVVKASAGASEHAFVGRVRNLSDFLAQAKEHGFWIYGAVMGANDDYTGQDYSLPTCFVLGSEGQGLGRRVTSLCDVMVSLPLKGAVESLNVSVTAGILLYEALRQRQGLPGVPGTNRHGRGMDTKP